MSELTKQDLIELLNIKQPRPKKDTSELLESLTKIAVAVCTAGIIWLITTVNNLQQDVNTTKIHTEFITQTNNELKERVENLQGQFHSFSKKPRFSHDDFVLEIKPLNQTVDRHTDSISKLEEKLNNIELKYNTLKSQLSVSN